MFFIQKNIVMHGTSMVLTFELKTRACRCVKAHSSSSGGRRRHHGRRHGLPSCVGLWCQRSQRIRIPRNVIVFSDLYDDPFRIHTNMVQTLKGEVFDDSDASTAEYSEGEQSPTLVSEFVTDACAVFGPLKKLVGGTVRKGKWSTEEEDYTSVIIQAFQTGLLPPSWRVKRGTTLRVFLATRLHCDAMRITKKFAGAEAIGKQVYRPVTINKQVAPLMAEMENDIIKHENFFLSKLTTILERRAARKQRATGKRKIDLIGAGAAVGSLPKVSKTPQKKSKVFGTNVSQARDERDATILLNFITSVNAAY